MLGAGCHRSAELAPATIVQHEISPDPARVGPVTITLRLAGRNARPAGGARITVEADMTHPGMSPAFGEAREIAPGCYRGQVQLGMAGDWVILVHAVLPGGRMLDQQFDVRGVRPD